MKKKLNVVVSIPNLHIINILETQSLHEQYDVEYFSFARLPDYRQKNVWQLPESLSYFKRGVFRLFAQFSKTKKADAVFFHGIVTPFPRMTWLIWMILVFTRKPVFISSEGFEKGGHSGILKKILGWYVNSRRVTFLSIGYKADEDFKTLGCKKWTFRKFCFAEKYPEWQPSEKISGDKISFLSVGRLVEIKNYESVIETIAALKKEDPFMSEHFEFKLAGSGDSEEKLKNLATELDVNDIIQFVGHKSIEEMHQLFLRADAFVLSSHYDGWGVVINQALHYHLPLLISKNVRSGQDYLVEQDENGFIYKDSEEMISNWKKLAADQELRKRFSEKSGQLKKLWDIEKVGTRLAEVINDPAKDYDEGPLKLIK